MSNIEKTVWCKGCGIEIFWSPKIVDNHSYCCQECLEGFPCRCGERNEQEEHRRSAKASTWEDAQP